MLGVQNLIDTATLPSYGSWVSTLPITNIQTRQQSIVARSTNAVATSTRFRMQVVSPVLSRVIGIFNHNISTAGTIRFSSYSDSGYSSLQYDSGYLSVFPNVFETGYATGWDDPSPGTPRAYNNR